jgi:hypothetical protein
MPFKKKEITHMPLAITERTLEDFVETPSGPSLLAPTPRRRRTHQLQPTTSPSGTKSLEVVLRELAVLEPKILICDILAYRKNMCWQSSEHGGRGCVTAVCFIDGAAMFRPRNDDGDLPYRRSGCPAAEEVAGEHTGEETLLRDAAPASEDPPRLQICSRRSSRPLLLTSPVTREIDNLLDTTGFVTHRSMVLKHAALYEESMVFPGPQYEDNIFAMSLVLRRLPMYALERLKCLSKLAYYDREQAL